MLDIKYIQNNTTANVIYFKELMSTQVFAKENVKNIKDKTVVVTDYQTNGHGTHGRIWHTEKSKNITMTLILKPNCDLKKLNGYTLKIAEFIQEFIQERYKIDLKIKEPNDLLLNNKKICGILVECKTSGQLVNEIYIGIGFNVNEINFNEETEKIATSLKKELKEEFSREEIIIGILNRILENYTTWSEG